MTGSQLINTTNTNNDINVRTIPEIEVVYLKTENSVSGICTLEIMKISR